MLFLVALCLGFVVAVVKEARKEGVSVRCLQLEFLNGARLRNRRFALQVSVSFLQIFVVILTSSAHLVHDVQVFVMFLLQSILILVLSKSKLLRAF